MKVILDDRYKCADIVNEEKDRGYKYRRIEKEAPDGLKIKKSRHGARSSASGAIYTDVIKKRAFKRFKIYGAYHKIVKNTIKSFFSA